MAPGDGTVDHILEYLANKDELAALTGEMQQLSYEFFGSGQHLRFSARMAEQ